MTSNYDLTALLEQWIEPNQHDGGASSGKPQGLPGSFTASYQTWWKDLSKRDKTKELEPSLCTRQSRLKAELTSLEKDSRVAVIYPGVSKADKEHRKTHLDWQVKVASCHEAPLCLRSIARSHNLGRDAR